MLFGDAKKSVSEVARNSKPCDGFVPPTVRALTVRACVDSVQT